MNSDVGRLFLDTTIQIERLIGPNPRRLAIERLLAAPEPQAITSQYVLMEFQRSVWSDYAVRGMACFGKR